ncbi:transposase [Cellulosimicrobium sp. NPDC055967]|uniref:transposase n=1 Tax=Cellulosimicrobium sp. NPDC055967 TaxID=3345670 RepID=UPI0035DD6AB6
MPRHDQDATGRHRQRLGCQTWSGRWRTCEPSPRRSCPSDLTNTAWARIPALEIPTHTRGGRPSCEHRWREYVDALLFVVTTGIPWQALPHDFHRLLVRGPKNPWPSVAHVWADKGYTGQAPADAAPRQGTSWRSSLAPNPPEGSSFNQGAGSSSGRTRGATGAASCGSRKPHSPPVKRSSSCPRSDSSCAALITTGSCSTGSR